MSGTYVSVESGEIRVHPSFADMLTVQRLGGRFTRAARAWMFPATEEHARLLRSKLRAIRATPEFEALLAPRQTLEKLLPAQPPELSIVVPEVDALVPDGILTSPWRHQKAAFKFCLDHFDQGYRGILLAMGMGCVEGDAELIINRGGNARRMSLREFHRKFHGGESNKRRWRLSTSRTRSMISGELHLNSVVDVIAQGVRPVVRLTLASGKTLRVTPDHEVAQPGGRWTEAGKLAPGDVVLTNGVPACKSCGSTQRVITYRYAKHVGICRACVGKLRRVKDKCIDKDGYVRLYNMDSHPRANKAGQVYEHIVVMERVLGRAITTSEHVHHKNHVRHDNRPENLEILAATDHCRHHGTHGGYTHLDGGTVHFVPKPDTVVSAKPDGETDVYDIRMAAPGHSFVANGIIVHNCGKSLVACMLALALRAGRVLIACPLRVVPVWVTQFERHVSIPVVLVALDEECGSVAKKQEQAAEKMRLADTLGRPFIVVVNYDSAWRDPFAQWAEKVTWDLVIADEAHRVKAPGGKASLFFKRLRGRTAYRVALTGTPMPHGPMDIYAIFRFLDVSIFGPSFTAFRTKYAVMGGYQRKQITGYQNTDELQARMARITFKVGDEVLDLPPAMDVTYYCVLTGEAARIYRDLEEDFVARVKDGTITAANAMVKLLRLQQITGGCVPTDDDTIHRLDSSKQRLLADVLEDIGKTEPVVIFCRFTADLMAVHEACHQLGLSSMELSGKRDELKRWQEGDAQVLAVQIDAGSEGVDFTRARYSIFYSVGYSLGKYDQARKRTHRPGQTRPVTHIHLIARGTVDVKIMRALEQRADIVQSILAEIKN